MACQYTCQLHSYSRADVYIYITYFLGGLDSLSSGTNMIQMDYPSTPCLLGPRLMNGYELVTSTSFCLARANNWSLEYFIWEIDGE